MAQSPSDVVALALDACMADYTPGDIEEGGRIANLCLRAYGEKLRELLRAAPWVFARKQAPLLLLADASGQTPNVGTRVPGGQFLYEYGYPVDCARLRYIPWLPLQTPPVPGNNIQPANPSAPVVSNLAPGPPFGWPTRPSRFLVTNDPNYAASPNSNFAGVQGQSPAGNTVILSNVQNASCVYSFYALYPSLWDHLFQAALVACIAQEIVGALWAQKDPKFALAIRRDQIAIAKDKVREARIADGNEMTVSADIRVDWMDVRRTGGTWSGYGGGGGGPGDWGCWGGGWAGSLGFGDGSSY